VRRSNVPLLERDETTGVWTAVASFAFVRIREGEEFVCDWSTPADPPSFGRARLPEHTMWLTVA
jgi:hypothetical protein